MAVKREKGIYHRMFSKRLMLACAFLAISGVTGLWIHFEGASTLGLIVAVVGSSTAIIAAVIAVSSQSASQLRWTHEEVWAAARHVTMNLQSINNLANIFSGIHMPVSSYSMKPSNLEGLMDILVRHSPKTIVELGSGNSTLLLAAWIKKQGHGRVISFDHDAEWTQKCREYLKYNRLDQVAEVRHAGLRSVDASISNEPWYDLADKICDLHEIDLLVVDGPPAGMCDTSLARRPALQVFYPLLSGTALIFVDDTSRKSEQEIVRIWTSQYSDLQSRLFNTLSGYCVLQRRVDGLVNPEREHERNGAQIACTAKSA